MRGREFDDFPWHRRLDNRMVRGGGGRGTMRDDRNRDMRMGQSFVNLAIQPDYDDRKQEKGTGDCEKESILNEICPTINFGVLRPNGS